MVQKTLPPGQLSAGLPQPLAAYYAPPIIAKRDPTVNDTGYPLGQVWDDKVLNRAWILTSVVAGQANWVLMGVGVGAGVQTVNGVSPVLGNMDLINQSAAGAITVTPGLPASGQVGLSVNVDGVTIQIVGNQLVATAVSPALTLTGDVGAAQLFLANNFNIQGGAAGAIVFNSSAAGQMDAQVQVDNVTLEINGANQLQEIGAASGTTTTIGAVTSDIITFPMGGAANVRTFDIMIVGFNVTLNQGLGYEIFGTVRGTGAAAVLVGTPDKINNEEAGSFAADANLIVSGNNAVIRVLGVAGSTINWRAIFKSINI